MKTLRVIGLMSGTSLDGIDAALLRTDGESVIEREAFISIAYPADVRERIRACFNIEGRNAGTATVEKELTELHAQVVRQLLLQAGVMSADVDLIGFHGQTVSHDPAKRFTCQLGDGALLASLTGIAVVNDFRTADVMAGGQGAPLVPVYHQAIASALSKPVMFLNIGGVANVTYIAATGELVAFDTGPGNALIDDWMLRHTSTPCDIDGAAAARGKVDEAVLAQLMTHPFFAQKVPKSLDRNAFVSHPCDCLSIEDGAATLAAFTAEAVAAACAHVPAKPQLCIVAGGGRLNKVIMRQLSNRLGFEVKPIDALGLNGDAIEAEAFAYMAVRTLYGLPISFPTTTGVPAPMPGGSIHAAPDRAA